MEPLHKEVLSEDGSLTDAVFCVFVWRPPGYTLGDIRVVTPPTKSFQSADKDTIRELQRWSKIFNIVRLGAVLWMWQLQAACGLWSSGNKTRRCIYIFHGPSIVCLFIALIPSLSSSLILTTTLALRTNKWKGLISVGGAKHHRLTFTVQGSGRSARAPEDWGSGPGAGGMFTHGAFPYWSYISVLGGEP